MSDTDARDAVELFRTEHGIQALDIVVANAGYGIIYGDLSQVKPEEVQETINISLLGRPGQTPSDSSISTS